MPKPAPDETVLYLWKLLKPLTSHADPTVEHEASYGGSNMDPMTFSLNTTRPAALRAAIRLASASHGVMEPGNLNTTETDILETVAAHVDDFNDPSLAVAAVIGEGLGRISSVDPSWVDVRQAELYSLLDVDEARRARSDVIVSVSLRVYRTGKAFLELIRPALTQMFTKRYSEVDHTDGWHGGQSAIKAGAVHTIFAYLLQIIDRDDPELQRLFSADVPVEITAEALGHIGWQIMRTSMEDAAGPIPAEYLARAKELIDWRVENYTPSMHLLRSLVNSIGGCGLVILHRHGGYRFLRWRPQQ